MWRHGRERLKMNTSLKLPKELFWVFLFCMFVTILVFAKANAITFPFPNEDDGSFFLPAWNLAVHGNLNPQVLNAPNGIYWMPHGFYVWVALFLKLFGSTIEIARSVSQITTATAAIVLTAAMAQMSRSRAFASLCGLLLVSPPVIYTANMTRMESAIFLLYALAILLHENRQYLPATAMLACSLLVHPALLLSVLLYAPAAAWLMYKAGPNRQTSGSSRFLRWLGQAIVVLVLVSLAAEALLVFRHADLFREQMAFQVHRKTARNLRMILSNRRGIILCTDAILASVGFYALRWSGAPKEVLRNIGPVLLIAIGLQAYAAFGYEQPYLVYSYAIVPATLLAAAFGAVPTRCPVAPV
jgi:heme exporter protein D